MVRDECDADVNVDAAWLGMDAPENLMMITAVLWFRAPVDWERLTRGGRGALIRATPKFSQRPLPIGEPFEQPVWTHDPASTCVAISSRGAGRRGRSKSAG
jgi:hypothetical protein